MFKAFKLLAGMRGLRGTRWDVFGYTDERKTERQLIVDYRETMDRILGVLNVENHALACEIARVPEEIRGYGHVKERHLAAAKVKEGELLAAFDNPAPQATAAE